MTDHGKSLKAAIKKPIAQFLEYTLDDLYNGAFNGDLGDLKVVIDNYWEAAVLLKAELDEIYRKNKEAGNDSSVLG